MLYSPHNIKVCSKETHFLVIATFFWASSCKTFLKRPEATMSLWENLTNSGSHGGHWQQKPCNKNLASASLPRVCTSSTSSGLCQLLFANKNLLESRSYASFAIWSLLFQGRMNWNIATLSVDNYLINELIKRMEWQKWLIHESRFIQKRRCECI